MPELINYQLRIIAASADHMHPWGYHLLVWAETSLLQLPDLLYAATVSFRISGIIWLVDGPCSTHFSTHNIISSQTELEGMSHNQMWSMRT